MVRVFKFTVNGRLYTVEVEDVSKSPLTITVNGEVFQVEWETEEVVPSRPSVQPPEARPPEARPAFQPEPRPASPSPVAMSGGITAPMPGKILAVRVKAGDKVSYGQEMCVLEAMKMEQSIKVSHEGVVKEVLITEGQMVKRGDVLVTFEGGG